MRAALDVVSPLSARVFATLVFAVLWVWFTIGLVFPDAVVRDVLDFGSAKIPFLRSYSHTCSSVRTRSSALCYLYLYSYDGLSFLSSVYTSVSPFLPSLTRLFYHVLHAFLLSPLAALLDTCLPSSTHIKFCVMGNGLGCERLSPRYRPSEFATLLDDAFRLTLSARAFISSLAGSITKTLYAITSGPSLWYILLSCFTIAVFLSILMLPLLNSSLDNDDFPTISHVHKRLAVFWGKLEATHNKFVESFDGIASLATLVFFGLNYSLLLLDGTFLDLCESRRDQRQASYFPPTTLDNFYCNHRRSEWIIEELLWRFVSLEPSWYLHHAFIILCAIGPVLYCLALVYDIWVAYCSRGYGLFTHVIVLFRALNRVGECMVRWAFDIRPPPSEGLPPDYELLREFRKQYKLGKNLGCGAFGYVYQARRRSDGREVAVKFVQVDDDDMWLQHPKWGYVPRDILVMSELEHEHIIKLIDVFRDEKYVYVVQELFGDSWAARDWATMERVPGREGHSLANLLARFHMLPLDIAFKIFKQLVSAVQHMHANGIAHCDIKPENILVDKHCNVRLIDFGGAQMGLRSARYPDQPEFVIIDIYGGTVQYAPLEIPYHPEAGIQCKPTAADIWALGIVLYEMVSGIRAPFRDREMAKEGLQSVKAKFGAARACTTEIYAVMPIVDRCLEVSVLNRADIDELMGLVCSR